MKKILLIFFLTVMLIPLYSSWSIGGEAGYALSFLDTVTTWPNTEYRPGHGATVSFAAEYDFENGLSLLSGIRYIEKSFVYYHANSGNVISNYMEMDHILEIPLSLRYSFPLGDISLFIGAGGYIGVWFASQWFGRNSSVSENEDGTDMITAIGDLIPFDSSDNLFHAGILAEAGVSWDLLENLRLDAVLRYEGSLTSLVKSYQKNTTHRYFDTVTLSVGCMIPIGGERDA